jgi:hypothetical protein
VSDSIRTALGRTPECPDVEVLLHDPRPANVETHVRSCAHCLAELALYKEFEAAEPLAEERADVAWIEQKLAREIAPPSAWQRARSWLAGVFAPGRQGALALVAACVLIAAASTIYLRQNHVMERPGPPDTTVWRSGHFTALAPSGDVNEAPAEFRWEAVPGAASYQVKLMEVDRTVIWVADATRTSVEIPINIRVQFRPARAFSWQVTARGSQGENLGATDLQTFHIAVTTH